MSVRRFLPRLALALAILAAAAAAAVHRDWIDLAALDAWLGSLGPWAPIGYIVLYALAAVAFVPGAVFGLAGGALFGPVWGSLWNLLGATLGATLAFLAARYLVPRTRSSRTPCGKCDRELRVQRGTRIIELLVVLGFRSSQTRVPRDDANFGIGPLAGDWVGRRAGGLLARLIEGVDAEGWRFVAFVRLVPLFPFNLSNYALGLTRIPLRHYVIATFVCMVPGVVAYTWLGYAGRGALTGEADTVRYGLLALGLLAAIALLPRLVGRLRKPFTWIEAKELERRLDRGEAVTVVDVRGPGEFTGSFGHIASARNIPVDELTGRLAELAGLERAPLVLVCRTDKRSATAAKTLRAAGFTQVSVLRRGMEQWNDAGLPVEGRAVSVTA